MKKLFSTIFVLALLSFSSYAQIKLAYNLDSSTEYSSKLVLDQNISQTIFGQVQAQQNAQGYGTKINVVNSEDGVYTLRLEYTSIMLKQPMAGVDYDSETATTEPVGPMKAFASVIGNGYEITIDKSGMVSSISGLDEMVDSMISDMELTDEAQIAAMKTQLASQYNEANSESQLDRLILTYPDRMLNKGDTWSADESITAPFAMNIQTTYELVDYDDETATINVTSDIFTEGEPMSMMGATMTPDLTGVQSGTITVDRNTGFILSSTLEQLISGVMNLTSPQEMEIPIEITGDAETKGTVN